MAVHRTPLHDIATGGGAHSQEWYGWELPEVYSDVLTEYTAATESAAVHDSSYVGRVRATGVDVLDLLHRLSTNDVVSLEAGQGAPTIFTTERGRVLDLVIVFNLGDHVLLLTGPQTRDKVVEWIDKYTIVEDVVLENVTLSTAMLSVIGPKAPATLGDLVGVELDSFEAHRSSQISIAGVEGHVLRRDMVGLPRYELLVSSGDAERVWQKVTEAGAVPMGLEAFEALRVGNGVPGFGSELGESYNPLETGLWGSVSFTKGCYIGQEVIARLDTYQKVQRHLVSLSFSPGSQVSAGAELSKDGKGVGRVTSVARVPTDGQVIGLAYIRKDASEVGCLLSLPETEGAWAKVGAPSLLYGPGE